MAFISILAIIFVYALFWQFFSKRKRQSIRLFALLNALAMASIVIVLFLDAGERWIIPFGIIFALLVGLISFGMPLFAPEIAKMILGDTFTSNPPSFIQRIYAAGLIFTILIFGYFLLNYFLDPQGFKFSFGEHWLIIAISFFMAIVAVRNKS